MMKWRSSHAHLHHEGHVGIVHASRTHVRGEHDDASAVAESLRHARASGLRLPGVSLQHVHTHVVEELRVRL